MRRGRIDIIGEILSAASEGIGKTALIYRTNLNFNIVNRYLETLSRNGFVSVSKSSPVRVRTMSKGLDFLATYSSLRKLEKSS